MKMVQCECYGLEALCNACGGSGKIPVKENLLAFLNDTFKIPFEHSFETDDIVFFKHPLFPCYVVLGTGNLYFSSVFKDGFVQDTLDDYLSLWTRRIVLEGVNP